MRYTNAWAAATALAMMTTAGLGLPLAAADDSLCQDLAGDPCETVHGAADDACRSLLAGATCDTIDDAARDPCDALLAPGTCGPVEGAGATVGAATMLTNCSVHPGTDLTDCSTTKHVLTNLGQPGRYDILRAFDTGRIVYVKEGTDGFRIHDWQADDSAEPLVASVAFGGTVWSHLEDEGNRLSLFGSTFTDVETWRLAVFAVPSGELLWDHEWQSELWDWDLPADPIVGSDGAHVVSIELDTTDPHTVRFDADGNVVFDIDRFVRPRDANAEYVVADLALRCFSACVKPLYVLDAEDGTQLFQYYVYVGYDGHLVDVEIGEENDLIHVGVQYVDRSCFWTCTYRYGVEVQTFDFDGNRVWDTSSLYYPSGRGGDIEVNATAVTVEVRAYPYLYKRTYNATDGAYLHTYSTYISQGSRPFSDQGPSGEYTYTFPIQRTEEGSFTLIARVTNGAGDTVWENTYDTGSRSLLHHEERHLRETGGFLALQTLRFADGTYGLRSIHLPYLLWDSDQEIAPGVVVPNVG